MNIVVQGHILTAHHHCGRTGGMQGTWQVLNLFKESGSQPETYEVPPGGGEGSLLSTTHSLCFQ